MVDEALERFRGRDLVASAEVVDVLLDLRLLLLEVESLEQLLEEPAPAGGPARIAARPSSVSSGPMAEPEVSPRTARVANAATRGWAGVGRRRAAWSPPAVGGILACRRGGDDSEPQKAADAAVTTDGRPLATGPNVRRRRGSAPLRAAATKGGDIPVYDAPELATRSRAPR